MLGCIVRQFFVYERDYQSTSLYAILRMSGAERDATMSCAVGFTNHFYKNNKTCKFYRISSTRTTLPDKQKMYLVASYQKKQLEWVHD